MKYANRYQRLPAYLFAGLEKKASHMKDAGIDLIDLGIGDPDLPPPDFFIESMKRHIDDSDTHLYPTSKGNPDVRRVIARWFKTRFGVDLDPDREICVTIGAKEGLANFTRAFVDPGDQVAVPDPGYPVYGQAGAILNEADPIYLPLIPEHGFVPDLRPATEARILFLNYPNNPTGAAVPTGFFDEVADFAESHPDTIVAHDAAYSEMTFGKYRSPSILQHTRNAIEFHSMSKLLNATGFRIGFAVGHAEYIGALAALKAQLDSGAPLFIQRAMADSLERYNEGQPPEEIRENLKRYAERRTLVEEGLESMGWDVLKSPATFYVWARVGEDEMPVIDAAIEKGVILTPGRGFGAAGQGYVRLALCQPYDRIEEALRRLQEI